MGDKLFAGVKNSASCIKFGGYISASHSILALLVSYYNKFSHSALLKASLATIISSIDFSVFRKEFE